jgi:predicted AAA+ superfamily ATPase
LYIVFRVTPYSKKIARSLLKEPKIYFFDTGLVIGDVGAKFENFVALNLLKHTLGRVDYLGKNAELKYLRTKEGKEADFALVENNEIVEVVEAKYADSELSRALKYFSEKYGLKGVQIVGELKREQSLHNIDIVAAKKYLQNLFL